MTAPAFDPVLLSVLAAGFEGVAREMSDTLLRSGRSSVINMARDFSCAVLTADNQVLALAEGLPIHVAGAGLLGEAMTRLHPDLAPGDAFLHNDPYLGNSHAADHVVLVPVFLDGAHAFTAVVKAHQADCGNALPTTYAPLARDQYEEGALIFPCVRVQRDGQDIDDIVRICRARIRVPDQWHGDYLGMIGAARIAEGRIHRLAERHGAQALRDFSTAWLDYGEARMTEAIRELPAIETRADCTHDAFAGAPPEGLRLGAALSVRPAEGRVTVDLRDNPDCLPNGLNLTQATATAAAITGVLGSLPRSVPVNAGAFRRIEVRLRENCCVGIPRFPASCSVATTNLADRVIAMLQRAFAEAAEGIGAAEGGLGQPPARAVVSGTDPRSGRRFVNQVLIAGQGGPATAHADGWPTYSRPVSNSLLYHDSVEIDEQRYPILIHERRLLPLEGGHGRRIGGQPSQVTLSPRFGPVVFAYAVEGRDNPPRGVRGGRDARRSAAVLETDAGEALDTPRVAALTVEPGHRLTSISPGGGGYGDPLDREPDRVAADAAEGRIHPDSVGAVYGVVLTPEGAPDPAATAALRARRRAG